MAFITKIATLLVLGVFSSSLQSAQGIEDTRKINTFGRKVVEAEGQVTELSQSKDILTFTNWIRGQTLLLSCKFSKMSTGLIIVRVHVYIT